MGWLYVPKRYMDLASAQESEDLNSGSNSLSEETVTDPFVTLSGKATPARRGRSGALTEGQRTRRRDEQRNQHPREEFSERGDPLGDPSGPRLEGRDCAFRGSPYEWALGPAGSPFPPYAVPQLWEGVPEASQPAVCSLADGLSHRVGGRSVSFVNDRLHALGNAVVPMAAALAFLTLRNELEED